MRSFSIVIYGLAILTLASCATSSKPSVDREKIRRVVMTQLRDVQACYEKQIESRPGAEGKLVMAWDIVVDGSVERVRAVKLDSKLEGIQPCIIQEIQTWKFEPPKTEVVEVEAYPFFFSENGRIGSDSTEE